MVNPQELGIYSNYLKCSWFLQCVDTIKLHLCWPVKLSPQSDTTHLQHCNTTTQLQGRTCWSAVSEPKLNWNTTKPFGRVDQFVGRKCHRVTQCQWVHPQLPKWQARYDLRIWIPFRLVGKVLYVRKKPFSSWPKDCAMMCHVFGAGFLPSTVLFPMMFSPCQPLEKNDENTISSEVFGRRGELQNLASPVASSALCWIARDRDS